MNYKKLFLEIPELEKKYKKLLKKLEKHPIFLTKKSIYLKEDKESFLLIWKEYIHIFRRLQFLIKKSILC